MVRFLVRALAVAALATVAGLEGDDVGRPGDVHELDVYLGDAPIGDDRDADLLQFAQGKPLIAGNLQTFLDRHRGETAQPRQIERNPALRIADRNRHAAEMGG